MSEHKAYEATPSRLERAKREGDSARSHELQNVIAFAGALIAAGAVVSPLGAAWQGSFVAASSGVLDAPPLAHMFVLMLVPAACAALCALACGVLQSGGLHLSAVTLNAQRLSPKENFSRMFSREAALTAVRASLAFALAAAAIAPAFARILAAAQVANAAGGIAVAAWNAARTCACAALGVGIVFALADYALQVVRRRKRLRMSYDELRRDQKEQDGDPLAKGRRRALHRSISRESLQRIGRAAFVVTNPTHIAVALEYRPPEIPVPRVLLSAADEAAARVREAAGAARVPIVENVDLARTLFATARAGDYIPHETYLAVAEVIAALTKSGVLE